MERKLIVDISLKIFFFGEKQCLDALVSQDMTIIGHSCYY